MKLKNINKAKVRKYEDGQKLDYSSMASGIGTLGTMAIDVATMDDAAPSKLATAGKGALSGAAALSAFGPIGTGVGFLAGGAMGLWQGGKEEDAYKAEQKKKEELANTQRTMAFNQSSQSNLASVSNRGFNSSGTQQASFYGKNGGLLKSIKYLKGGELQPVSKNTQLAVGQSHENGGIKLDAKSEIEGGETLVDKGDHTLVVSDNLVNPLSGNTFAKDDLKLAKTLGRFEGKTSNLAKNSIKQINAKREILHNMQQKMNGNATDNETLEAKNGMKMYGDGGTFTEDKQGNKSLVTKDGTYAQLPDGRTRYKSNKSNTWEDVTDSKALAELESTEPKFKLDSNKSYDSFTQGKFNSNDLQGGQHYYADAKSGKIIRVARSGPNKDVEIELNDLEAKEVDKTYFGGKYFAPKPRNKDFIPSDPANLFTIKPKPPLRPSGFSKEDTSVNPTSPDKLPVRYKAPAFTMPDKKKARLAKEEPRDYTSLNKGLGSLAKLSSYVAPHIMDWANENKNIARLKAMNIPDAPQQGFANLAKQNMEVDRAEIRKQQANYNAGISGTLADSQTAALMKANMSEKASGAISGVNQNQRNANTQISNAQTEMNLGIDARNKAGIYAQKQQQMEKDVDISNRQSSNTSNLLSGFRDVQNTYRQEHYADAALDVDLAGMSPEARAEFDKITNARGAWGRMGRGSYLNAYKKNGGKLTKLAK